jgi:hypothetical protein
MENKQIIHFMTEFYNSEKNLFLAIVTIGIVSIIVGFAFHHYSTQYKVFGISLLILGSIETGIFLYSTFAQQAKIEVRVEAINTNTVDFLDTEKARVTKMIKVYFGIKLFYASLILLSIVIINYSHRLTIKSILMALILHLALAITVDNFAELYTQKYKRNLLSIT